MKLIKFLFFIVFASLLGCQKNTINGDPSVGGNPSANRLGYGDSVFYLKSSSYTITPTNSKTGTYSAFPNNLNINSTTGAITVSLKGNDGQSQTGLKYKIKFTPTNGEADSTYITISGVTYIDRFYELSQNDSIIRPIYNADISKALPDGNYTADNKLAINNVTGEINIKETIRRGFFDNQMNTSWKQTTIGYTTNDNSHNAKNTIDIILYYYDTYSNIPSNVSALMQAHQRMAVGITAPSISSTTGPIDNNLSSDLSLSKPRPPCLIIIGH